MANIEYSYGVCLDSKNKLSVGKLKLPELLPTDVLIEVYGGPINPSDVYYTQGLYPVRKNLPTICGFEGSGVVIKTGGDPKNEWLKGQKVCFSAGDQRSFGTWGTYTVMPAKMVFPLPEEIDLKQGASCLVNPLTVEIFMHECEKSNHKVIVHNGAAGSLGKMLLNACLRKGITLINIVRKDAQIDQLKKLGAEHVLNSSVATFEKDFVGLCRKLRPTAFFDAVTGKPGAQIIVLMPPKSTTYVYGNLERDLYNINPATIIFKNLRIRGLWLSHYFGRKDFGVLAMGAFENLKGGTYKTVYAKEFTPDKIEEAFKFYENNASAGKVLIINPNFKGQAL